jgi:hypothetical protein
MKIKLLRLLSGALFVFSSPEVPVSEIIFSWNFTERNLIGERFREVPVMTS